MDGTKLLDASFFESNQTDQAAGWLMVPLPELGQPGMIQLTQKTCCLISRPLFVIVFGGLSIYHLHGSESILLDFKYEGHSKTHLLHPTLVRFLI